MERVPAGRNGATGGGNGVTRRRNGVTGGGNGVTASANRDTTSANRDTASANRDTASPNRDTAGHSVEEKTLSFTPRAQHADVEMRSRASLRRDVDLRQPQPRRQAPERRVDARPVVLAGVKARQRPARPAR